MHPLLLELGPIKLYSYGLMMAIGFFLAIGWGTRRAPRYKVPGEFISNLTWVIVIGGVLGGRIGYMLFEESVSDLFSFKFFEFWNGGMVFYAGFLGSALGIWAYCRKHGQSFLTVADILSPTLALGHFLGRIGCLLAGCCYGKQCDLPWAIEFHHPLSLAPQNVRLHPTQIYEMIGNLIVVGILLLIEKRVKFRGQIFICYLVLYAGTRAFIETFRGDVDRGFVTFWGIYENEWLSTSTFIAILMVILAVALTSVMRKTPSDRV